MPNWWSAPLIIQHLQCCMAMFMLLSSEICKKTKLISYLQISKHFFILLFIIISILSQMDPYVIPSTGSTTILQADCFYVFLCILLFCYLLPVSSCLYLPKVVQWCLVPITHQNAGLQFVSWVALVVIFRMLITWLENDLRCG